MKKCDPIQRNNTWFRRHWTKFRLVTAPKILIARIRRKKFSHFISLGNTCEVAFRFWWTWRFLDSCLFAWANNGNLEMLIKALKNLNAIASGDLEFHESYTWLCKNTGIFFHGKMKRDPNQPQPSPEAIAADRKDLVERLAHLKEKFIRQASDIESTLFAYRIPQREIEASNLESRLSALEDALNALGAQNWKLLLVAERRYAGKIPRGPRRFIRHVESFNPADKVTMAELGDPVGWRAIFTEFAPQKILRCDKKFKFE